jgi:hypothetical protein
MWAFRCGFFRDCRDIARWDVQCELAEALGVDINAIEKSIHDGTAFARLAADYQDEALRGCWLPDHRSKHSRIIAGAPWRPSQLVLITVCFNFIL